MKKITGMILGIPALLWVDTLTVNAQYSAGEILKKAGINTLLGMGTVFTVLIFISVLISLFRLIPLLEERLKKGSKEKKEQEIRKPEIREAEKVEQKVCTAHNEDTEVVAVIAAAIAAMQGCQTDQVVIRSIRRRPANNWKK